MPILHMDVAACQSSQGAMLAARDQMKTEVAGLVSAVNQMVGNTWIAPAGNQFLANFQGWNNQISTSLETLAQLSAALGSEIDEWLSVANSW